MGWDRSQPTDPKYRSKQHRDERAKYVKQMKAQGYLVCQQPQCLMPSRTITPQESWHLGHDDTGTTHIGPTHAVCNRKDGARRGRARQNKPSRWKL